jgi:hypothetical protein
LSSLLALSTRTPVRRRALGTSALELLLLLLLLDSSCLLASCWLWGRAGPPAQATPAG